MRDEQMSKESLIRELNFLRQELSDRKRAEQISADFLDQAPVAIHWIGPDGIILWANKTELQMLGYAQEEFVGRPIADFHVDKEVIDDILKRLAKAETLNNYSAQLRCKDASIKKVMINSNVYWEDGKFIHTRCFTRDITEHVLAIEKLNAMDERLRLVSEAPGAMADISERKKAEALFAMTASLLERIGAMAKIGGWELDLRTMKPFWSLETYHIHEIDPSVIPTLEDAINFYAPEARPIIRAAVQAGIDHGTPWDMELPFVTAKGRHIWVRAQGSAMREDGKVVKLFGAFQDISERKLSEETLKKRIEELKLLLAITVDRENAMIDLKKEINALAVELNRVEPYDLSFLTKD